MAGRSRLGDDANGCFARRASHSLSGVSGPLVVSLSGAASPPVQAQPKRVAMIKGSTFGLRAPVDMIV